MAKYPCLSFDHNSIHSFAEYICAGVPCAHTAYTAYLHGARERVLSMAKTQTFSISKTVAFGRDTHNVTSASLELGVCGVPRARSHTYTHAYIFSGMYLCARKLCALRALCCAGSARRSLARGCLAARAIIVQCRDSCV